MRARSVVWIAIVVCAAAGAYYLVPGAAQRVQAMLGMAAEKPAAPANVGAGVGPRGIAVVTATATTADFPVRRYAIGFVSSPAVVNVSARVSSQVTAIAVKDGQMVKAGDLLFSLDDRALKAQVAKDQATLAKDQAMLVSAQADMQRAQDLAAKQAGTQQAYDQALAAAKAAEATVAADEAALDADTVQLGYTSITASISGRLGAVNVTVGDLVGTTSGSATTPMVTITQMDPLQVGFNLPEADLDLLRKALADARADAVTLSRNGSAEPIGKGTLDFIDSTVDTASGTIAARASVPNPDMTLWPGQYVDVVVDAGIMPQMVSVPTVAIQPSQKGPFVYVVKDDGTVEMRPVQVALAEGDNSAVSGGLKSGERVVVDGQLRLKDGAAVRETTAAAPQTQQTGDKVAEDAAGGPVKP